MRDFTLTLALSLKGEGIWVHACGGMTGGFGVLHFSPFGWLVVKWGVNGYYGGARVGVAVLCKSYPGIGSNTCVSTSTYSMSRMTALLRF